MQNVSEVFGPGGWSKRVFFVGRLRGQCLELKTLHGSNLFRFVLLFSEKKKNGCGSIHFSVEQ